MPIDEIEVIKQKLVDQIKPIGVYLFGSFANGTAHADSDFDFYIIVDDSEKDLHAVATSAYKAIRGVKQRPVDILVGTKSRFDERKNQFTVENEVFNGIPFVPQKFRNFPAILEHRKIQANPL